MDSVNNNTMKNLPPRKKSPFSSSSDDDLEKKSNNSDDCVDIENSSNSSNNSFRKKSDQKSTSSSGNYELKRKNSGKRSILAKSLEQKNQNSKTHLGIGEKNEDNVNTKNKNEKKKEDESSDDTICTISGGEKKLEIILDEGTNIDKLKNMCMQEIFEEEYTDAIFLKEEDNTEEFFYFTLENSKVLIFYKEINIMIKDYKEILKKKSVGPLPVEICDHIRILEMLIKKNISKCYFYVKSKKNQKYELIRTIPKDIHLYNFFIASKNQ